MYMHIQTYVYIYIYININIFFSPVPPPSLSRLSILYNWSHWPSLLCCCFQLCVTP